MAKVRCVRCSAENDLEQSGGFCSQCGSKLPETDIQSDDDVDIRRRPGDLEPGFQRPTSRFDDDIDISRRPSSRRYDEEDDILRRRSQDDSGDLSTGDWLLCIFCSGIGCIVGIARLVQGRPNAGKMIGISLLFGVIWGVVRLILTEALRQQPGGGGFR